MAEHALIYADTRTSGEQVLLVGCNFTGESPRFEGPSELRRGGAELLIAHLPVDWPVRRQTSTCAVRRARLPAAMSDIMNATHRDSARLLADVGGTNARFAWQRAPGAAIGDIVVLPCAGFATLADAIERYLATVGRSAPPNGAIAIANPVTGDRVQMTNHHWSFSITELQAQFSFDRLRVLNDFTALALALPTLRADELRQVGGGEPVAGAAVALIGPGTGLGVSGLIADGRGGMAALEGEGGHATLAGRNARERQVLQLLEDRYGHASAERAICGQGLVDIHAALQAIDSPASPAIDSQAPPTVDRLQTHEAPSTAAEIVAAALERNDPRCCEAVALFCAFLGTAAGNVALTLGARGGVYIGGGIVPRLGDWFDRSPFRERFEAKGRFAGYLEAIPVYLIVAEQSPALRGAAGALDRGEPPVQP